MDLNLNNNYDPINFTSINFNIIEGFTPIKPLIDYCEPNFLHFESIQEPFNFISSLFIFLIGLIGIFECNKNIKNIYIQNKFIISYYLLSFIGISFASFHLLSD